MGKYTYGFNNLCGVVYKTGNVVFTPDGNTLLSPVGNRVSCFDLVGCVRAVCAPMGLSWIRRQRLQAFNPFHM